MDKSPHCINYSGSGGHQLSKNGYKYDDLKTHLTTSVISGNVDNSHYWMIEMTSVPSQILWATIFEIVLRGYHHIYSDVLKFSLGIYRQIQRLTPNHTSYRLYLSQLTSLLSILKSDDIGSEDLEPEEDLQPGAVNHISQTLASAGVHHPLGTLLVENLLHHRFNRFYQLSVDCPESDLKSLVSFFLGRPPNKLELSLGKLINNYNLVYTSLIIRHFREQVVVLPSCKSFLIHPEVITKQLLIHKDYQKIYEFSHIGHV